MRRGVRECGLLQDLGLLSNISVQGPALAVLAKHILHLATLYGYSDTVDMMIEEVIKMGQDDKVSTREVCK